VEEDITKKLQELLDNQKAIIERLNNLENFAVINITQLKNDLFFQSYQQFHTLQLYTLYQEKLTQTKNQESCS